MIIDKALTSQDLDIYILLLDMSKAFDTVNRRILLEDLQNTLAPDKIHLLAILTNLPRRLPFRCVIHLLPLTRTTPTAG